VNKRRRGGQKRGAKDRHAPGRETAGEAGRGVPIRVRVSRTQTKHSAKRDALTGADNE